MGLDGTGPVIDFFFLRDLAVSKGGNFSFFVRKGISFQDKVYP